MVEVKKNINESTSSLLRRFKKKIKQANTIAKAKSKQYKKREASKTIKKKMALRKIERMKQKEYLHRWGKNAS